jgi:hypothetical protein
MEDCFFHSILLLSTSEKFDTGYPDSMRNCCLFPFLFAILSGFVRSSWAKTRTSTTCTKTLSDADKDASGGLSLDEFVSFLGQEAAKDDLVLATTASTKEATRRLFTTFAGTNSGEMDITGASATDISQVPRGQQAILELICVKSKALIHHIATGQPNLVPNTPFLGEELMLEPRVGTRQQLDNFQDIFFGLDILELPMSAEKAEELCPRELNAWIQVVTLDCPTFIQDCPSLEGLKATERVMEDTDTSGIPPCAEFQEFQTHLCPLLNYAFSFDPECCLLNTITQHHALALCAAKKAKSEDWAICSESGESLCQIINPEPAEPTPSNSSLPLNLDDPEPAEPAEPTPSNSSLPLNLDDPEPAEPTPTTSAWPLNLDFYGTMISESLPEACESSLSNLMDCTNLISDLICPDFVEKCKDPNAPVGSNISMSVGLPIPNTCTEFSDDVCGAIAKLPESCCLPECTYEFLDLAACVAGEESPGQIMRECPLPYCLIDWLVKDIELASPSVVTVLLDQALLSLEVEFFGIRLNPSIAETNCSEPLSMITICMEQANCSTASLSCVREVYEFPAIIGPNADSLWDDNTPGNITPADFGCTNLTETFCELVNFPDTCCLSKCTAPIYELATCLVDFAVGDGSDLVGTCPAPTCVAANGTSGSPTLDTKSIQVSVNSSFLISTTKGTKAAELKDQLKSGNGEFVKVFQDAYSSFARAVYEEIQYDSQRRQLAASIGSGSSRGASWMVFSATSTTRGLQDLGKPDELDPTSAEIYDFRDSPCNNTATAVAKQGGTAKNCISVFGKYSLLVHPDADAQKVYEHYVAATTSSITEGTLQSAVNLVIAETIPSAAFPFAVEGVSTDYDDSFVPFKPKLAVSTGAATSGNISTSSSTGLVAINGNSSSSATANVSSTNAPNASSTKAPTAVPSSAHAGMHASFTSCLCIGILSCMLSAMS